MSYKNAKLKAYKNGEVHHDHSHLGRKEEFTIWVKSDEYSRSFWHEDHNDMQEYIDSLSTRIDVPYEVHIDTQRVFYDEVEHKNYEYSDSFLSSIVPDHTELNFPSHYPAAEYNGYRKRKVYNVVVTIEKIITNYYTEYCTDYEHYDPITDTDTRDGGKVTCTPDYGEIEKVGYGVCRCRCLYCSSENKLRDEIDYDLNDLVKYYNAGVDLEEIL